MQFEVGKTYSVEETPSVCNVGFHFCEKLAAVHEYYRLMNRRVCEVEAFGVIDKKMNKSATNEIRIIRELSREEICGLSNSGSGNTGYINSGDRNSGDRNSGYQNSGFFNSCNNSAGIFMSRRISYEAFNKSLTEDELGALISSNGYDVCKRFRMVKYRVRAKTGKFGDFRYMGYKESWKVFWNGLSVGERMSIMRMPFFDADVFFEITGVRCQYHRDGGLKRGSK
jgi:hypothetical protein